MPKIRLWMPTYLYLHYIALLHSSIGTSGYFTSALERYKGHIYGIRYNGPF